MFSDQLKISGGFCPIQAFVPSSLNVQNANRQLGSSAREVGT
jgi:hypothetical protein